MTAYRPTSTALVLLDLQEHNLSRLESKDELIKTSSALLSACRSHGFTVAHIRVAFDEDDYGRLSAHNRAFSYLREKGSAMKQGIHASLPHMQFHASLAPLPNEIAVRKTRIGAFSTTDLHAQLQQRNITTLIIAGISTSGAVLSTVRDAADKDYAMTLVSDACADTKEEVHRFLLNNVLSKTCLVQTCNEVIAGITA